MLINGTSEKHEDLLTAILSSAGMVEALGKGKCQTHKRHNYCAATANARRTTDALSVLQGWARLSAR